MSPASFSVRKGKPEAHQPKESALQQLRNSGLESVREMHFQGEQTDKEALGEIYKERTAI
jgi:hypothetical protein